MLQWGQLIALGVLFLNAILMTLHKMPSTFGPAIQAGNWYTLGFLTSLKALGVVDFSMSQFFLAYVTWLVLAVAIVNGAMALMKAKRHGFIK
jgi:multisubunit Na+/H+ antiporter MnhG subunit